jgi:hypothetical protein
VLVIDDWNGMGQRTTGSGTVVFSEVNVPSAHVVPAHLIFEKTEIFGAFGQYMHACVDLGIAIAALRDLGRAGTAGGPVDGPRAGRARGEPRMSAGPGQNGTMTRGVPGR